MKSRITISVFLLAFQASAFATGGHEPPPKPQPEPTSTSNSTSGSRSSSESEAAAAAFSAAAATLNSANTLSATTGSSSAVSGPSNASVGPISVGTTSGSNSGGNQFSVNTERSAPSFAQGGMSIPPGCSIGLNGGGSTPGGGGFLGAIFQPEWCKELTYAAAYQTLGAYQASCDIINTSKYGKEFAKRGVRLPTTCEAPKPVATELPTPQTITLVLPETVRQAEPAPCLEPQPTRKKPATQCLRKN